MSLQEKLDQLKAQAKTWIPPEARAVMERAVEDVRRSGIDFSSWKRLAGLSAPATISRPRE